MCGMFTAFATLCRRHAVNSTLGVLFIFHFHGFDIIEYSGVTFPLLIVLWIHDGIILCCVFRGGSIGLG
jgi:hypothetical protein